MHIVNLIFIICLLVFSPAEAAQTVRFLSLADIHFDPFISCDTAPCPLIQQLNQSPSSEWGKIFSQEDFSRPQFGENSDYFLLESSLDAIKKISDKANIHFALVIGDLLAHHFNTKYQQYSGDKTNKGYISFVKKNLTFLTAEIKRTLPNTNIYLAVGNNDSYQNDYASDPNGVFFKDLGFLASTLIKEPQEKSIIQNNFSHAGYYALTLPHQPRLRLIVLNSVLFSTKAKGPHVPEAARQELAWLDHELREADKKQQQTMIVMHIPTGIDVYTTLFNPFQIIAFWKSAYSQQFLSEVKKSAPHIMGVFTAHIHSDSFQILTEDHHAIPFAGTPSISPIYGNNPGFKIYGYSLPALKLNDEAAYYYSLDGDKKWRKEYEVDSA